MGGPQVGRLGRIALGDLQWAEQRALYTAGLGALPDQELLRSERENVRFGHHARLFRLVG